MMRQEFQRERSASRKPAEARAILIPRLGEEIEEGRAKLR